MKHRTIRHRGFVMLLALILLGLIGAAMACLSTTTSNEARRTLNRSFDAQLEQMLLAAAMDSPSHFDARQPTAGDAWEIELPPSLTSRSAALRAKIDSVQEDPRTIVLTIQARFDGRHAEQTARYIRDEKGWKLVSAELVAT